VTCSRGDSGVPSRWLHVGCDEVVLGKHPTTQRALTQMPLWRIYAEHVQRLQQVVSGLGRQMIIWGDHLIASRACADLLSREITVHDWAYWPTSARAHHGHSPARLSNHCRTGPGMGGAAVRPAQRNLDNVAEMVRRSRACGALGTIVTVWVPTRFPARDPVALCSSGRSDDARGGPDGGPGRVHPPLLAD